MLVELTLLPLALACLCTAADELSATFQQSWTLCTIWFLGKSFLEFLEFWFYHVSYLSKVLWKGDSEYWFDLWNFHCCGVGSYTDLVLS